MRQTNRCSLWRALQHILIPAIVAAAIAFFCQPVYLADGKCDFGLLALLIGIPFGIQKMVVWFVPRGYGIGGTVAMFVFDILVGELIGFFVFLYRIIRAGLELIAAVIGIFIHV